MQIKFEYSYISKTFLRDMDMVEVNMLMIENYYG